MNLSERLLMNVSLVPEGAKVADIGCDHGYAAIWLVRQGISDKVIAMDVNRGPIERARKHVHEAGLDEHIECRQSDGTEKLLPGEVDTLMITGMGGPLMTDILAARKEILDGVNTLILQPQSEIAAVRRFLLQYGFFICREKACQNDGKYYFAILAEKGDVPENVALQDWQYRYGTYLVQEKNPILMQYLLKERNTYLSILGKMEKNHAKGERKKEIQHMISDIEKCLDLMASRAEQKGW